MAVKARSAPILKRRLPKAALPWCIGTAVLAPILLLVLAGHAQLGVPLPPLSGATSGASLTLAAPPRGHLHAALYEQGIAHIQFHLEEVKVRLAAMVRHFNHVAIVGVEGGHDVLQLAKAGYRVDAFEPMSKYIEGVTKWVTAAGYKGVTLHHSAAGNVTGGYLDVQYVTGQKRDAKRAPRLRLDSVLATGLDVLSVDIQGGEWRVVQGALGIIRGPGVRMLWVELQPCDARVAPLLRALDALGYALFDMLPFGAPAAGSPVQSAWQDAAAAAANGWQRRSARFDDYLRWFCAARHKWLWMQTDLLAIRRDVLTPAMMLQLRSLNADALFAYKFAKKIR